MMRDSKNVTAVCDEPSFITQDQCDKAQATVANYVVKDGGGREEVEAMMMMLGIHPTQKELVGMAQVGKISAVNK